MILLGFQIRYVGLTKASRRRRSRFDIRKAISDEIRLLAQAQTAAQKQIAEEGTSA